MKKICFVLLAAALALGMTKCKKNDITPNSDGDTVFMTLDASCGGGRTVFDPSVPGIRWSSGAKEYISVGSSVNGYLGELSGKSEVSTSATNRLSFSGTITAPAGTPGEKLYFFYLGNGKHSGTTSLNFSNQETSAGAHFVTDFVVAIGEGTVSNSRGTYTATADLEVKTAIAYFNISAFSTGSDDDNVYLRGDDVYSTATIDYRAGTITGNAKGSINIGSTNESNKYVALIPSVSTETTLIFEGATKEGTFTLPRGIQANRYYSNDGEAMAITGKESYVFTVSSGYETKKVRFSPGNLQYKTGTGWRFAEHQYDVCQTSNGTWNTSGWVDLFGWGTWSGTSAQWNPTNTSDYGYSWESNYDDVYFHGSLTNHTATNWFTLSCDQWQYLIGHSRHGLATITVGENAIHGMVILPDNSELSINTDGSSWSDNAYSESQWVTNMEAKGAVFLPATGYREGTSVNYNENDSYYWSCTEQGGGSAWCLSGSNVGWRECYLGLGVRLVR